MDEPPPEAAPAADESEDERVEAAMDADTGDEQDDEDTPLNALQGAAADADAPRLVRLAPRVLGRPRKPAPKRARPWLAAQARGRSRAREREGARAHARARSR